ncbi:MAG: type I CRISPR-associated protein Cas7 [Ignavibacteriaceae bacterium]|nr:type I CRISPR-associated protein Cas7 [Ignavibacteriaceae bacterium]
MSETNKNEIFNRATGLLVIEVVNSNPNGDPDKESDPRQRNDQRGEITPVSFKRKIRDLVENKKGPVWESISQKLKLEENKFGISESRNITLSEMRQLDEKQFTEKFWDGRVFGNTELEKGRNIPVKTGVVQFGLGVSIAPIEIERMTTTNPPVEGDKKGGMAPLSFRIVTHGIYCMPFFINPSAAYKTECTVEDIDLLLNVIPHTYKHTASYIRSNVDIVHAWYIEHKTPLGSCSDFDLINALTPTKLTDPEKPSTSRADYKIPTEKDIPEELRNKVMPIRDLMKEI